MGLDATLRVKARPTARDGSPPLLRDPQRHRHRAVGSGDRHGPRGALLGDDLAGKAVCRADLLTRHGIDPDDPAPVLGMIGRLDPQKGFDILADAAPDARRARRPDHRPGQRRRRGWPIRSGRSRRSVRTQVALVERFDRVNARRIYAGSDLFLMPSRFEPCGQGQMIALRYGTPPVVRRTGGLGDTVVDETERPGEGTGFVFDEPTPTRSWRPAGGRSRVRGPVASTTRWAEVVGRGMALDFGWETGSAPRYALAYRRACGAPTGGRGGARAVARAPSTRASGTGRPAG